MSTSDDDPVRHSGDLRVPLRSCGSAISSGTGWLSSSFRGAARVLGMGARIGQTARFLRRISEWKEAAMTVRLRDCHGVVSDALPKQATGPVIDPTAGRGARGGSSGTVV
jgi:hypothetical protein